MRNKKIRFILFLPYAIEKYFYIADSYRKNGDIPIIISQDKFLTDEYFSEKYNLEVVKVKGNIFKKIYNISKIIYNYRPETIDLYDYSILTVYIVLFCKILKIKSTLILIGSELYPFEKDTNKKIDVVKIIKMLLTWASLFLSDTIVVKEIHQQKKMEKNKKLLKKSLFLPNSVPLTITEEELQNREILYDFSYVNAILKSRNLEDYILSLKSLDNIKYNALIAGFYMLDKKTENFSRDPLEEKNILQLINSLGIRDLEVLPFIKNSREYLLKTKFFVFPGDTIFLNYTLLEAMSLGVVPIVYDGEGAEKVIVNNENGFIIKKGLENLSSFFKKIVSLDEIEYNRISFNAYRTVKEKYSIDVWTKQINNFRNK